MNMQDIMEAICTQWGLHQQGTSTLMVFILLTVVLGHLGPDLERCINIWETKELKQLTKRDIGFLLLRQKYIRTITLSGQSIRKQLIGDKKWQKTKNMFLLLI